MSIDVDSMSDAIKHKPKGNLRQHETTDIDADTRHWRQGPTWCGKWNSVEGRNAAKRETTTHKRQGGGRAGQSQHRSGAASRWRPRLPQTMPRLERSKSLNAGGIKDAQRLLSMSPSLNRKKAVSFEAEVAQEHKRVAEEARMETVPENSHPADLQDLLQMILGAVVAAAAAAVTRLMAPYPFLCKTT